MTPTASQGAVDTITLRAGDGATAQVRLYRIAEQPDAPVVVCMPAMGTQGAYYAPLAEALRDAGLQVAIGELRGQGSSSIRPGRDASYGYHEIVTRDYPALFRAVESAFPASKRYLLGHSLGGQLGALYLSLEPHMAQGAILVGAPSCWYRAWPFPSNLGRLAGIHLALLISRVYGYFPGTRLGILGDDSRGVLSDLASQMRTGDYRVPSTNLDFEHLLSEVNLPVLAVVLDQDNLATAAGVRGLGDKLARARLTYWTFSPDKRSKKHPHYGWIRDNAAVVERVRTFVSTHA